MRSEGSSYCDGDGVACSLGGTGLLKRFFYLCVMAILLEFVDGGVVFEMETMIVRLC